MLYNSSKLVRQISEEIQKMNMKMLLSVALTACLLSTSTQTTLGNSVNGGLQDAVYDNYIIEIHKVHDASVPVAAASRILLPPECFLADTSNPSSGLCIRDSNNGAYDNRLGTNDFSDDYFTISRRTYTSGADLVAGVFFGWYFCDQTPDLYTGQYLMLELVDNHFLADINSPNLRINEITIRAKQNSNAPSTVTNSFQRNDTFTFKGGAYPFMVTTNSLTHGDSYDTGEEFVNGKLNIVDLNGKAYDDYYARENEIYVYGRAYDKEQIYINLKYLPDHELLEYYVNAENIRFYQVGIEGAAATWRLELSADKDDYVYEMHNGILYKSSLVWDDSIYAFTGTIRGTVDYVVSATPLDPTTVYADTTVYEDTASTVHPSLNPNTGR